jgi:putative hydrolase of the HAD superfamily
MREIKNIIFDLGGVIINLDYSRTIDAFNRLSGKPFETLFTQLQQNPLFDQFDKGTISEADFFGTLKTAMDTEASQDEMHRAWNAMLLDFPQERLDMLQRLKHKYRIFLLSNTNETHVKELEAQLQRQHGHENLEPFFEKVYYSCRIGMRKPDLEVFEFVLKENGLLKSETIFIDDSPQHVQGAINAGINSYYLTGHKTIDELVSELGL